MPNPGLSRSDAEDAVAAVDQALREGFVPRGHGHGRSAVEEAGRRLQAQGILKAMNTIQSRLRSALSMYGLEPDWSLYRPVRYQQPRPQFSHEPAVAPDPELTVPIGEPRRILVIPDRHNDPRRPHRLDCTTWIARYGSEHRFPEVVCLGDAVTMDSCSRHDKNDTLKGRYKPPIKADLDNHEQSLIAFERGRDPDWKPKKRKARGNHEERLFAFENDHPEDEGTHTHRYCQDLAQFGWMERPYGEFIYVNGVAFTHAPMNGMGRPMGGKTSTHRAGSVLTCALVHGHTHQLQVFNDSKSGPLERISVVQAGCALPWGEYEDYSLTSPGGWWWGVLAMTVWGGQIVDLEAVSMLSLRNRYSDDGADRRAA